MAKNIFKKLFSRNKRNVVGMTAEEAYAPEAPEDSVSERLDMRNAEPDAPARTAEFEAAPPPREDDAPDTPPAPREDDAPDIAPEAGQTPASEQIGMSYGDDAPFEFEAPEHADVPYESDIPGVIEVMRASSKPARELWLYACMDNPRAAKALLRSRLIAIFGALSEDEDGFVGRLPSGARVRVQLRAGAALVREQTGYLKAQYQKSPFKDRGVQNAALMQIELFNAMVTYTLTAPYIEGDPLAMKDAAFAAARTLRAFLLTENAELYRWDEKLLISPDGRTEFSVFMPTGHSSGTDDRRHSEEDDARVLRSLELMRKHGLNDATPPGVQTREADARLRSPSEIIARMAAVFACALQAQAYNSPGEISAPASWSRSAINRLDIQYGVNHAFTRKEAQYCLRPAPSQHAAYFNGFEACAALLWALGLIGLSWPSERADLSNIMRVVRDADTDMLMRIAKPRSLTDVLDMHDLTYRLHRASLRADFDGKPLTGLDSDVVYERHYALNWLVATDGITEWDMVVPKT